MASTSHILIAGLPSYARDADNGVDGAVASTTPIENIVSSEPSQHVRFTDAKKAAQNYALIQAALGDQDNRGDDINCFAVLGHTLTPGAGEFLFRILNLAVSTPAPPTAEFATPDAIAASSNLAGVVGNIDEDPYAPDGLWLTASSPTTNTSARFTFEAAPVADALIQRGDNYQTFSVYVRKTSGGLPPSLTIALYNNGVAVRTLLSGYSVSSTTGELVEVYWDFAEVGNVSTNVEILVTGTVVSGSTLEIGAVRWIVDQAAAGLILFDSEWRTIPADDPGALIGNSSAATVGIAPTHNHFMVISPAITGAQKGFEVRFRDASNAAGVIDIGLVMIGYGLQPEVNVSSIRMRTIDPSAIQDVAGGQQYGDNLPKKREFDAEFPQLTKAEAFLLYDRIDFRKGRTGPFLVSLFPDDATFRDISTAWVTASSSDGIEPVPQESSAALTTAADHPWRARYTFTEKL